MNQFGPERSIEKRVSENRGIAPPRGVLMEFSEKLELLRKSYKTETGKDFDCFYCPLLFRDEGVELCEAHIVNQAFQDSSRSWTVQRKDIDNFYGYVFEGDFVDIRHLAEFSFEKVFANETLAKRIKPQISYKGNVVGSYFAKENQIPAEYTPVVFETSPGREIKLVLKIHPEQCQATKPEDLQVVVKKDLRLPALVSLVKAAHLTLFEMLGYNYALSAGGQFVGWNILGKFFVKRSGRSKPEILKEARSHFDEFKNMVRPVLSHNPPLAGTIADNQLYVCEMTDSTPWAFIVFIRTSQYTHAVVIPILSGDETAGRFIQFLKAGDCVVKARFCRFENGEFKAHPNESTFQWAKADLDE